MKHNQTLATENEEIKWKSSNEKKKKNTLIANMYLTYSNFLLPLFSYKIA